MSDENSEMGYMEILQKARNYETIEEVKDCCVNILTEFVQYNFCFIEFETDDYLGVYYTHTDFTERFILIVKKYIVSVSVVYQQDMNIDKPNVSEYI
ncbi:MAG: hypothetical protein IKT40_02120 [Bacilli bacterium]|nr:hypothetical protein [Bacilli bacterium]